MSLVRQLLLFIRMKNSVRTGEHGVFHAVFLSDMSVFLDIWNFLCYNIDQKGYSPQQLLIIFFRDTLNKSAAVDASPRAYALERRENRLIQRSLRTRRLIYI